jgi:hypothetical protein
MKNYKRYCILTNCFKISVLLIIYLLIIVNHLIAQPILSRNEKTCSINYSSIENWAAHPWKKDNSDSISYPLKNESRDSSVDVFFIHPTTYTDKKFTEWNASIFDEELNKKTDQTTILYQASVFNGSCRIFAPRYRQAHIRAFYINNNTSKKYFDTAYNDIKNAFEYYLKHFNNGRPIIIASHSQGTLHAGRLLKDYFENNELQKQLVCAYIVGMPIPNDYFKRLNPCKDSTQTGCFVGWRTFKKNYEPEFVKKETFQSVVINPLTWVMTNENVSSKKNKGGILLKYNKIIPGVVDATVHQNILWTSKPNIVGKIFIRKKNYHIGDINLFYMNIRENIKCRINQYNIEKSKN